MGGLHKLLKSYVTVATTHVMTSEWEMKSFVRQTQALFESLDTT